MRIFFGGHCKTENLWIAELLHSKYGRIPINPLDFIRIILMSENVVLLTLIWMAGGIYDFRNFEWEKLNIVLITRILKFIYSSKNVKRVYFVSTFK